MKKILIFIIINFLSANYAFSDLNNSLIAYYPFNNNGFDASFNNNDAMLYGNPSFSNGIKGQAVILDGIDDYIDLGIHNFNNHMTLSLWVKIFDSSTDLLHILSKYDQEKQANGDYILKKTFILSRHDHNNHNKFYFTVSSDGRNSYGLFSNTEAALDQWYHIVALFDEGTLSIYINGVLENTVYSNIISLYNSDIPVLSGKINDNNTNYSNIVIDDLRFYDRILSKSEISTLYSDKTGPAVVNHSPAGLLKNPLNYIDVIFNKTININRFTKGSIVLMDPSGRPISIDEPVYMDNEKTTMRINFSDQSSNGTYKLRINNNLIDEAGNQLDQDKDGICGENEDFFEALFKVSVVNHSILFVHFANSLSNNNESENLSNALTDLGAKVYQVELSEKNVDNVISLLDDKIFDQIWVYDMSAETYDNYSIVVNAISKWFNEKSNKSIICDGRMRESLKDEIWMEKGIKVIENYYENLKLNGGGLLLATGINSYHNDINEINKLIGISPFSVDNTNIYENSVLADTSNDLMSIPNNLSLYFGNAFDYSNVPFGKQTENIILYPVAWYEAGNNYCVSTTIQTLIPNPKNCYIERNSGYLFFNWDAVEPYHLLQHYSVYIKEFNFSSVESFIPSLSPVYKNTIRIDGLKRGLIYYIAVTAVNISGGEIKSVKSIPVNTNIIESEGGGGCFINSLQQIKTIMINLED